MIEAITNIRIVLIEPAGALNVGAIARVMKNMGLVHLVLVNPKCDHLGLEARQMAMHAGAVLQQARVVTSLVEGLSGCRWAIATTGRPRTLATLLEPPKTLLPWLLEVAQQDFAALIFGPEDRGLNNSELNYAQRFLTIPSNPEYPSLNLAQAVAVCCYELYQMTQNATQAELKLSQPLPVSITPAVPEGAHSEIPAPLEAVEAFYQHLETVLLDIGYLYPHTAESRMQKFRRLLSRALPSSVEIAMLRGILSQVEWAIHTNQSNHSQDDL